MGLAIANLNAARRRTRRCHFLSTFGQMVRALNCSGICKRNHGEDNSKSKCARCFTARRMQVIAYRVQERDVSYIQSNKKIAKPEYGHVTATPFGCLHGEGRPMGIMADVQCGQRP